jgi:hypothetical protein
MPEENLRCSGCGFLLNKVAILVLCAFLASCGRSSQDVQEDWTSDVQPDKTTRREVLMRFGIPEHTYQGEEILVYDDGLYNVIFVFDEKGVLIEHKVTEQTK